jgi:DNA-binding NarL/FixJ family response regulator
MPDVLIIDMDVAGEEISETISRITARHPETRIIALSLRDNGQDRLQSMRAGAKGFIDKTSSTETVIEAIRQVLTGGTWFPELDTEQSVNIEAGIEGETIDVNSRLTKREIQIFEMIGSGTSAKEISNKLFISQRTVESHRDHIKNKLEFKDAFHLHQFAFEWVSDHKKVKV